MILGSTRRTLKTEPCGCLKGMKEKLQGEGPFGRVSLSHFYVHCIETKNFCSPKVKQRDLPTFDPLESESVKIANSHGQVFPNKIQCDILWKIEHDLNIFSMNLLTLSKNRNRTPEFSSGNKILRLSDTNEHEHDPLLLQLLRLFFVLGLVKLINFVTGSIIVEQFQCQNGRVQQGFEIQELGLVIDTGNYCHCKRRRKVSEAKTFVLLLVLGKA